MVRSLGFGCDYTIYLNAYNRLADPLYKRYQIVTKQTARYRNLHERTPAKDILPDITELVHNL